MTTKEASKKWDCTERIVQDYCKSGIIPLAEKESGKWSIPDEMQSLPPVTVSKAVYLLKCLLDQNLPITKKYWDEEKMVAALEYLSDMRFISNYEGHSSLEEAAKKCKVSKLGKELIEKAEKQPRIKKKIGGELGFEGPIPQDALSFEYENEK